MKENKILNLVGSLDGDKYPKLAVENAAKYQNASPFPHIVIDNFLDPELCKILSDDFPPFDGADWVVRDNEMTWKKYQHDETKLPVSLRLMLREFNSRQFVLFLETLTGIDNLIPDPYFIGGGAHIGAKGAFLKIHADFNWHHKLQAHRRVNALLYLNPEWKEEWGGALEFWNKEMTEAEVKVMPVFSRLVVFSTDENSNHGHPYPMTSPDGVFRKALNLYYYTTKRPEEEIVDPHFTLYKTEASPFAKELKDEYLKNTR